MAELRASREFLDAAGSAPLSARTRAAYLAAIDDGWAEPSRLHSESRAARALVDGAREEIAAVFRARPELTRFTHSPYTALSLALAGLARARRGASRVVVTAVERVAVLETASAIAPDAVDTVAVDATGALDVTQLADAVSRDGVAVAAVQHANRETGRVQELAAVSGAASAAGVPLFVDATASIGHVAPPDHWDALAAHPADWGGPGGLGVVSLRPGARWLAAPGSPGNPWAPGGVNVPAALAAAVALQEREATRAQQGPRMAGLVARFAELAEGIGGVQAVRVGDPALPHVITLVCDGVDGEAVQAELDRRGFAVGSGSACTAGDFPRSHVLDAMGLGTDGNIRLGLHPGVDDDAPAAFAAALADALGALRAPLR